MWSPLLTSKLSTVRFPSSGKVSQPKSPQFSIQRVSIQMKIFDKDDVGQWVNNTHHKLKRAQTLVLCACTPLYYTLQNENENENSALTGGKRFLQGSSNSQKATNSWVLTPVFLPDDALLNTPRGRTACCIMLSTNTKSLFTIQTQKNDSADQINTH